MCGSTLSLKLCYREKKMQWMIKDIKFTRWSEVKASQSCPTLKSLSHVPPLTIQSMEFFRPEYWDGQPLPSSGDLPNSGIEPRSPALQVYSLPAEPQECPRILEWVAFPFSRGSSQPGDWTQVSCIAGVFFTGWATREAKDSVVGSLSVFQQIFLIQGSNRGLPQCRWILYQLSHQGSPRIL